MEERTAVLQVADILWPESGNVFSHQEIHRLSLEGTSIFSTYTNLTEYLAKSFPPHKIFFFFFTSDIQKNGRSN